LGVNMVLNVVIVVPWVLLELPGPHAGLAAATSLGAFLNAGLLYRGLRRDGVIQRSAGLRRFVFRVLVAVGVMVVFLLQVVPPLAAWLEAAFWTRVWWLALVIAGAVLAYAVTLLAVGVRPPDLQMKRASPSV